MLNIINGGLTAMECVDFCRMYDILCLSEAKSYVDMINAISRMENLGFDIT